MGLKVLLLIARRHLFHNLFRTGVSVSGVAIGVTFMVMLSALMTGFETKFVRETIESSPHVTIYDEYRGQTDEFAAWTSRQMGGVARVDSARPRETVRRIKKPLEILKALRALPEIAACAPNVTGTAIMNFGTRERGMNLVGIVPEDQEAVSSLDKYIQDARIYDLYASGGALLLGYGVAEKLGAKKGDTVSIKLRNGDSRALRVI
ncbi:MAG TPA: ABC transporter permease, partial [Planctomycetota bacterium]|nr:ABC transporter permease [Planctomycetota bacterium]